MQQKTAIVIGDSFNNTLGLIRSLGEAQVLVILILVGYDRLFVGKSRYVSLVIRCESLNDCNKILKNNISEGAYLICSNDKAAKWVDDNEYWLSKKYLTPMRGAKIGTMFDKSEQCAVAESFGISVPKAITFTRSDIFPIDLSYPVLLKPANSNIGEKSDIHICYSLADVNNALNSDSNCFSFIVQEYIEKDYEINLIGVSTDNGAVIPGGIKKIRHYPTIYSPCSYGKFLAAKELAIDTKPIENMIVAIGYKGPFSVEFIRKDEKDYFMEINFRHDGLAYTATAAGANLLKMYIEGCPLPYSIKPKYMMDLSIDFCHVKDGNISRALWIRDFLRTGCQLNFKINDPMPTIRYYLNKLTRK